MVASLCDMIASSDPQICREAEGAADFCEAVGSLPWLIGRPPSNPASHAFLSKSQPVRHCRISNPTVTYKILPSSIIATQTPTRLSTLHILTPMVMDKPLKPQSHNVCLHCRIFTLIVVCPRSRKQPYWYCLQKPCFAI